MAKQSVASRGSVPVGTRPVRKSTVVGRRASSAGPAISWGIPLGPRNFMILGAGIAVIVIGYLLMYTGVSKPEDVTSTAWQSDLTRTIAPLLLVIGYCVVVPFGIFYRSKDQAVVEEPVTE